MGMAQGMPVGPMGGLGNPMSGLGAPPGAMAGMVGAPMGMGGPMGGPGMFAAPGGMYTGPPLGAAMQQLKPPLVPGMMGVPPPLSAPPPAAAPSEANAWKEYKDASGRSYYHDTRTNKTTYEKPACLKTEAERTLAPCKWKEYPTPDGRKYYSDGTNSVWSEPAELTEYKARLAALEAGVPMPTPPGAPSAAAPTPGAAAAPYAAGPCSAGAPGAAAVAGSDPNAVAAGAPPATASSGAQGEEGGQPQPSKSSRKRALMMQQAAPAAPLVFNSQEERTQAFIALLKDYCITSGHKWGDVNRLCSNDPRWAALPTTGGRKQVFSEYQAKAMKEEKEEKRSKQRKQRDLFLKLLATDTSINMKTRWRDASARLATDERYVDLEFDVIDEREREDMFNEFVSELARKEEEERKAARRVRIDAFTELLNELPAGTLTHSSRWLEVRPTLEDRQDARFEAMDETERRHVFSDVVALLKKEHDALMREKEKERLAELKARQEAYTASLTDKVADGTITATSTWRDCKLELEQEPTFIALEDAALARTIFDDVILNLQRAFRADRKVLLTILETSYSAEHKWT